MRLVVTMQQGLLLADGGNGRRWTARRALEERSTQCLARDSGNPALLYCGSSDAGLWRSEDAGESWLPAGELESTHVTAVAVSGAERISGRGVVYAGTEPSRIFRSEDGGRRWQECGDLSALPSSRTWSFPPRPHTHHVRWIAPDPVLEGRLHVAIEAGALVRSLDGGATWKDRAPGGPYDTHMLAIATAEPGRLHSAAGDGYFVSADAGESWSSPEQGLEHGYLWSVAVDPGGGPTVLVSAASGPFTAHRIDGAQSTLYRRVGSGRWQELRHGLPEPDGTTVAVLARDEERSGVFYAANNHGLYRSPDGGATWVPLEVPWPDAFRTQRAAALTVLPDRL